MTEKRGDEEPEEHTPVPGPPSTNISHLFFVECGLVGGGEV